MFDFSTFVKEILFSTFFEIQLPQQRGNMMIDSICNDLTKKIQKKVEGIDEEKAEIIDYGLHLLIGEIPKTFVFIAVAALLGVLKEFFITVCVIFPYRAFSGGFHLKTHLGCIILTSLMYCGIPLASKYIVLNTVAKYIVVTCTWIFGMIMCKLYAPADTQYVPVLRSKERKIRQNTSYILLTIILSAGTFVNNTVVFNIIWLGMLVQSMMISRLAYKLTNNQYGHELYEQSKEAVN